MLKYEGIPPHRYFELIVHQALHKMNEVEKRADIFMNKMLGYQEYSTEADILCAGRRGDESIGIIIECKNFVLPKKGDCITYYDKIVSRESLFNNFKKKREQAHRHCEFDRVIVLAIFNDEDLKFEKIDNWLYVLGCKVEFPKQSFPNPQDTQSINHVWNSLSEGMIALGAGHSILKNIKNLPNHRLYKPNRDYPLDDWSHF